MYVSPTGVPVTLIFVITSISRFNVYTSMSTGGSGGSTVSPSDITISTDSDLLTIDNATGVISPKTATSYGIANSLPAATDEIFESAICCGLITCALLPPLPLPSCP